MCIPDICPCCDAIDICCCFLPLDLLCCCLPCCRPRQQTVVYVPAAQPYPYVVTEPVRRY